ncbi:MAG: CotH kinase family protein [Candidatus Peregrinibacteria bacterium]|nr:CotH kinase family protein [Candidatus Peregrinibacteria bacterium]
MRRLKLIVGVLGVFLALDALGVVLLALLLYQVTPKSTLAHETFIGRIPGLLSSVRVIDRSLNIFYWGPRPPEPLPLYSLRVDPKDLRTIEESLPTTLPSPWYGNVFLTEDAKVTVKGTFTADGEEYPVDVRVRGDIFNHWAYRKKSWRITFSGDQLFQGMREINLIIPEDRGWIAEPLNVYRAKKMGFVQPPVSYVRLSLNRSGPMVYTQIEQWGKEMLEKQSIPGDVNLYGAGGGTSYFQQWDDVFGDVAYWNKYQEAVTPPQDSVEEIELLQKLSQVDAHADPAYRATVEAFFDVDQIIDWHVLSLLAGSRHVRDHNLRFFHDISRGKLVPIPWDISLYWPRTLLALPGNPFLNEFFRVPEWKHEAQKRLWAYVQDDAKIEEDLAEAQRLRSQVERAAYRDSVKLPSNRQVKRALDEASAQVQANIDWLKNELSIAEVLSHQRVPSLAQQREGMLLTFDFTVRGVSSGRFAEISLPKPLSDGVARSEIHVLRDTNEDGKPSAGDTLIPLTKRATPDKLGLDVYVLADDERSLLTPGDPIIGDGEEVRGAPHTRYRFFLMRSRGALQIADADLPLNLELLNAVTGEKAQVIGDVMIDDRTFERLAEAYADRATFLRRYPAFRAEGTGSVLLTGTHTFKETVIIPSTVRLRIAPGTIVRMDKGVTLLSYAPVSVIGTQAQPIRFEQGSAEPWGSFLVVNAKEQSTVQWAEFSGGGETFTNDIYATGMVAFHGSPVSVRDATFRNSHGDDALNIKYVPADIARAHFIDAGADALDVDVAKTGVVEDSTFFVSAENTDSNGDGLDLSWSSIVIRNLTIEGSRDKCISVGESSKPTITDVILKRCHFGIASKDGSSPTVTRAQFIGNDIAVTAYVKKPIFSLPMIEIRESTFSGNAVEQEALSGATITIIR